MIAFATNSYAKDKVLFNNGYLQIHSSKAIFKQHVIYDAEADFKALYDKENTENCEVEYTYHYAPLSLVGPYYSYEFSESGSTACGATGHYVGVKTVNLHSKKTVSITELFDEMEFLKALQSDKWVQKISKERNINLSKHKTINAWIKAINQLNYGTFSPSAFTILGYSKNKNKASVRFVAVQYMGFNNNQHLQLGLELTPTPTFQNALLNEIEFTLGKFKNGLSSKP